MDKRTILLAENLAYELPSTRTLFQSVRLGIEAGDRIALVGPNGSGKSTLLKILAGQISPSAGSVWRHGSIYYLPQISTVKQEIEASTVLDLLSSVSEEWWKIGDILEAKFNTTLDLSLPVAQLSGGELTKLFLAIGLSQEPNLLLLDEPTNHMDLLALESLKNCLDDFDGAFVIVSHKPFFLDQVAEITWELTPKGINVYGGNFSLYREQKETELEVMLRSHEVAKKELKRAREAAQKEQERAARSKREGRLQAFDNSMGKGAKRYFENRASASAGNAAKKHQVAVDKALQKVTETKVRTTKATSIQLEERSQKRRNLIEIQGANLWVAGRLLIKNIQLHLSTGDRVAIAGHNGSGKSSLAKAILGRDDGTALLESGEILIAPEIKAVYLDQTYELIDREQTILENMQAANPDLDYQLLRQQLGRFLFSHDDVRKPASVLSGGELARLALAIISISEIDLLILDEPTNNLDIATVEQMVEGINEYHGALWVISHDLDFLSKINITQGFKLQDRGLQMTAYLPYETEQYYRELLH